MNKFQQEPIMNVGSKKSPTFIVGSWFNLNTYSVHQLKIQLARQNSCEKNLKVKNDPKWTASMKNKNGFSTYSIFKTYGWLKSVDECQSSVTKHC